MNYHIQLVLTKYEFVHLYFLSLSSSNCPIYMDLDAFFKFTDIFSFKKLFLSAYLFLVERCQQSIACTFKNDSCLTYTHENYTRIYSNVSSKKSLTLKMQLCTLQTCQCSIVQFSLQRTGMCGVFFLCIYVFLCKLRGELM